MTETTIFNYQDRAKRTLPDLGSKAANGAHMALGITTEIGEMIDGKKENDVVNVREEHGDANWYIANTCNIYELSFEEICIEAGSQDRHPFKLHDLVDLHKKELAYGKEIDPIEIEYCLICLVQYLMEIASNFKFTYNDSLNRNIQKLYKRYPEKFSEEKALNRDLEAEGETLK